LYFLAKKSMALPDQRRRRNCHLITTICLFATAKADVQRCRPGDWKRSASWSRTTTVSTLVVSGTACREKRVEHLRDGWRAFGRNMASEPVKWPQTAFRCSDYANSQYGSQESSTN
jgi:hypothetical protein